MIELHLIIHYATISLMVALPALGVALGSGTINSYGLRMINEQPSARAELSATMFLATVLNESIFILNLVMVVPIVLAWPTSILCALGRLSIIAGLSIPSFYAGLRSSYPACAALSAVARQPLSYSSTRSLMMLCQIFLQSSPVIFGLGMAYLMFTQSACAATTAGVIRLIAAGLTLGIGACGVVGSLSTFGAIVCRSAGIDKASHHTVRTFALFSQSLIEGPIIFATIIAIALMYASLAVEDSAILITRALAAALVMGTATGATAWCSGRVASAACIQITRHHERASEIRKASLLAQALVDTSTIWGFLTAIGLLLAG